MYITTVLLDISKTVQLRKYCYLERPVQKSSYYRLVSNEVYDQQKKLEIIVY